MITVVWVSFLSLLLIIGVLYSIFSSNPEDLEEGFEDIDPVQQVSIKTKPIPKKRIIKKSAPKKVKKKTVVKSTPIKKSKLPKKSPVKPSVKTAVKSPVVTKTKTVKTKVSNPVKKTPVAKSIKTMSTTKATVSKTPTPKSKSVTPKSKPKVKTKPKSKTVKKPVNTIINASGFTFNGDFDQEEIAMVKKFSSMSQGQIIQTHMGKIVLNKWIKTKPKYQRVLEELDKRSSTNGSYETYIIWYGEVTKALLDSKLQ